MLIVGIIAALVVDYVKARLGDRIFLLQEPPAQEVREEKSCQVSSIGNWEPKKAVIFDKQNRHIRLPRGELLGYILSPESCPEHAEVTVQFRSHSEQIDFFVRLENSFEVIIGDGDNRSVALKKYSPTNPLWEDVVPPGFTDDRLPKYFLHEPIAAEKDVTIKLTIDAPEAEGDKRVVQVALKFFNSEGDIVDSGGEEMRWEFSVEGSFNGDKRYGLGLVTKQPLRRQPSVTIHDFSVKERQQKGGVSDATSQ